MQARYAHVLFDPRAIQLCTRLRVDVFPDDLGALGRAALADVEGVQLRVVAADDLLTHKLALLAEASVASPVEDKHFTDAWRLGALTRRAVPEVALSHLTQTAFSRNLEDVCLRCQASRDSAFPLASKRAIFDVLGYV